MATITDLYSYAGVLGFFFLVLQYLLRHAANVRKKPVRLMKEDNFFKTYGYNWDYVFVFDVYDEEEKSVMNSAQKEYTMKNVIDRIDSSGMETACFYSVQRDEIYVKVRCPPLRLRQEAARIDYQLLLDRDRLRVKAQSGKKNEDRNSKQVWKWKGISITDEQKQSPLNPYDFIPGGLPPPRNP